MPEATLRSFGWSVHKAYDGSLLLTPGRVILLSNVFTHVIEYRESDFRLPFSSSINDLFSGSVGDNDECGDTSQCETDGAVCVSGSDDKNTCQVPDAGTQKLIYPPDPDK